MHNFAHYERFMITAAGLICPKCPEVEYGAGRAYRGSPERIVYLFWTAGENTLCELTVEIHRGPPLNFARIYGNMERRRHSLAMVRRLGLPERPRTKLSGTTYATLAPWRFEMTCRECELPQLAEVAVALAEGRTGSEVSRLPGARELLDSDLRAEHPSYIWSIPAWVDLAEWQAVRDSARARRANNTPPSPDPGRGGTPVQARVGRPRPAEAAPPAPTGGSGGATEGENQILTPQRPPGLAPARAPEAAAAPAVAEVGPRREWPHLHEPRFEADLRRPIRQSARPLLGGTGLIGGG